MSKALSLYIDHTQLKPETTKKEIDKIIKEAIKYNFASICINPSWVEYSYQKIKNTDVKVCTVVGFPLGSTTTEAKVFETKQAIKNGATEIDMVLNIGQLKSNNDSFVKQDIKSVVQAAGDKAIVKVIIETSLLSKEEKIRACKLAEQANAHFVKTSTGFSGGGATIADIKLMKETVGEHMEIKASGGIRDLLTANQMIEAGATRIGASAGVSIIEESIQQN